MYLLSQYVMLTRTGFWISPDLPQGIFRDPTGQTSHWSSTRLLRSSRGKPHMLINQLLCNRYRSLRAQHYGGLMICFNARLIICVICKHHRMGLWKANSGESFAVMVGMILVATSMVQAQNGHVTIVNSFYGPTRFTCHSNKMSRQAYTAVYREAYYFAFDTIVDGHQFWDCQVNNQGWVLLGEFRFWGDASNGGHALGNCENCSWSVEDSGVYMYVDGGWRLKYIWNR